MHDQPSVSELVAAVRGFISDSAAPQLTGHAAFHARVAINVLDIVLRDLDGRAENDRKETASLAALLDVSADAHSHSEMVRMLCEKLRSSELTLDTPGLLEHLKTTAIAQLEVDQPKYSGLREALGRP
ncbi:MAG: DUF6285 domain-containing protein [Pseudomonadota bacterium]